MFRTTQSQVTVMMYHLQRSLNVGKIDKLHALNSHLTLLSLCSVSVIVGW
jgi:hypothetical protein